MKSTKLLHAVATTPHLLQQLCPSVWQSHSSAAQSADAKWKNLPMAGGWNWVILNVSSNSSCSMILLYFSPTLPHFQELSFAASYPDLPCLDTFLPMGWNYLAI